MPTTDYIDFSAGVRAIGDRTDNLGVEIDDWGAEEDRLANIDWWPGAVTPDDSFAPSWVSGWTLAFGSGVAKRDIYAVGGLAEGQGVYLVQNRESEVEVTVDVSSGSGARIDEVYLVVLENEYDATGLGIARIAYRAGDVGGGNPGPDASWQAYELLWRGTIAQGSAALSNDLALNGDMRQFAHQQQGVPAGTVLAWARASVPRGFLWCQGQTVSRTTYRRLFAAIGTTWGSGDGSTTFHLPNLQERFIVGAGGGYSVGDSGGASAITLTVSQVPPHSHTIGNNAHVHEQNVSTGIGSVPGTLRRDYNSDGPGGWFPQGVDTQSHTHNHSCSTSGAGQSHENRPPYRALRYVIAY